MRIPNTKIVRRSFIAAQPEAIRRVLNTFFSKRPGRPVGRKDKSKYWLRLPYWRILPVALAARANAQTGRGTITPGFLKDIQWAQYCLFLFIRFQDDVFDGQAGDRAAIYASDQCLFEAERLFAKHFERESWFWKEFRRSLILTTHAIVEVDELQRTSDFDPESLLEGYVRVNSILKIGSAAVCAKANQKGSYKSVASFCDEMAKAAQIMDDLSDLDEDMERKRCNYASRLLITFGTRKPARGKADDRVNDNSRRTTEGILFAVFRLHVKAASQAIARLAMREMMEYLENYPDRIPSFSK